MGVRRRAWGAPHYLVLPPLENPGEGSVHETIRNKETSPQTSTSQISSFIFFPALRGPLAPKGGARAPSAPPLGTALIRAKMCQKWHKKVQNY